MRDDGFECSEESLSALLDGEMELTEKRALALHVAVCVSCARTLGQLFAARVCVHAPAPGRFTLPRRFWRGVREGLNEVDGLIRATEPATRRRPLVARGWVIAAAAAIVIGVVGKAYLAHTQPVSLRLTRMHVAGTMSPHDPGLTQAVGLSPHDSWQPVSRAVTSINGMMVLRTVYSVDGLPVSVFRMPAKMLDTRRLVALKAGNETLYLAASERSSMVARRTDQSWQVVISRSPIEYTVNLALTCPQQEALTNYPNYSNY
jgi:anti-sigma factor RsiW